MSGRLLVIDRAGRDRALLISQLEAAYFDVLTAETGDGAMTLLAAERVDLILMSLDLKGFCGIAVCRRLK